MSAELTPADLAKFIHPIPKGAVVPVGTRYVARASSFYYAVCQSEFVQGDGGAINPRWTAEPLTAPKPEPTLAERAHSLAKEAIPGSYWHRVTVLVAELAEKVEAQP